MRTLIVMRHAKAEHGAGKPDFDRTLEPRGIAEAARVAERLADAGILPDRVLCSAARRTRDTFAAMLPLIGGDCVAEFRRALYDAEVADLREAARSAAGNCVLIVGHNPSVHVFAQLLAAGSPRASALSGGFPTSHAAVFSVGFALDSARFERLVTP
jgi:phosphohistidine phosphatase